MEKDMARLATDQDLKRERLRQARLEYLTVLREHEEATRDRNYDAIFEAAKQEFMENDHFDELTAIEGAKGVVEILKRGAASMCGQREYIERQLSQK